MKNNILSGLSGLLLGLIIGFVVANNLNRNTLNQPSQTVQNQQFPNQNTSDIRPQQPGATMPQVTEILDKADNEPNNFEAQSRAAELFLQIQNFAKAAQYYENANKIKPDDYETIVKIGNAHFDAQNYETAEKWYLEALKKNPDDVNVRTDLGITFVERPNPDFNRAIKEFQTSLEKNPKHEPSLYNLGYAYFKLGNTAELAKILNKFDEINPNSELAKRLRQATSQK